MIEKCIFCNSNINEEKLEFYQKQHEIYYRKTSYQTIIDIIIDQGDYDKIFFDHDKSLGTIYRDIAYRKRSALQEEKKKGRKFQRNGKWPDINCVNGSELKLFVEIEKTEKREKAIEDFEKIVNKKYLYVEPDNYFDIINPILVIAFEDAPYFKPQVFGQDIGNLKGFIICDCDDFEEIFNDNILPDKITPNSFNDRDKVEISSIGLKSSFSSQEIYDKFGPKSYDFDWYIINCTGEDKIPEKAVNGHNGGPWIFYSLDGKIMRSGESTLNELNLKKNQ